MCPSSRPSSQGFSRGLQHGLAGKGFCLDEPYLKGGDGGSVLRGPTGRSPVEAAAG